MNQNKQDKYHRAYADDRKIECRDSEDIAEQISGQVECVGFFQGDQQHADGHREGKENADGYILPWRTSLPIATAAAMQKTRVTNKG